MMARLRTLRQRKDFLRLRQAPKWVTPAFILQGAAQPPTNRQAKMPGAAGEAPPRFGFTVSRRALARPEGRGSRGGGAVERNRARRRLREAVRLTAPECARAGFDYVVIGRAPALSRPFADLLKDMRTAFARVHSGGARPRRGRGKDLKGGVKRPAGRTEADPDRSRN